PVVEDPDRPLPADAEVAGTATIVRETPERVEVATDAKGASYLILADTFDPRWSATLDGGSAPIRPAYLTFRAVYVPRGRHTVVFRYRPAGFLSGLIASGCGLILASGLLAWPRPLASLAPEHGTTGWRPGWPRLVGVALAVVVLASGIALGPGGRPSIHRRWTNGFHRFTWGAGIEAIRPEPGER
ncbi:MAG: YfhO family protein, partial [Singulisphaera sp.]